MLINRFKWVEDLLEFNKDFRKYYIEKSNEGHFLEVDVQCPEYWHELHKDLSFLTQIKKIDKDKVKKLAR